MPCLQREAAPCWAITRGGEAGLEEGSQWGEAALGCVMSSLYLHVPAQLCAPPPSLVGPQMPWVHFLRKLTRTHIHAHYFMGASKNNP